jgi:hypothetical protein
LVHQGSEFFSGALFRSLENAAAMANHARPVTTQLYDHRRDEVSLDEVERISI